MNFDDLIFKSYNLKISLTNDPLFLFDKQTRQIPTDKMVLLKHEPNLETKDLKIGTIPPNIGKSTGHHPTTQDVQFLRLQIIQDSLQKIRQSLLHHHRRQRSKLTHRPRTHAKLC